MLQHWFYFRSFKSFFYCRLYSSIFKTQYREMTCFVVSNNELNYPIISEFASYHQKYYFNHLGAEFKLIRGIKAQIVDSIISKEEFRNKITSFSIIRTHLLLDSLLDEKRQKKLDFLFNKSMKKDFFDAQAQLYNIRKEKNELDC